jgi:anti-anti-sigma factor
MAGIGVRESRDAGVVLVELRGEFDQHDLQNLRETLDDVAALGRPALLDLAGVTFLDVGVARELAIRSQLHAGLLTLHNPSWQVWASVTACGLGNWLNFRADVGNSSYQQVS